MPNGQQTRRNPCDAERHLSTPHLPSSNETPSTRLALAPTLSSGQNPLCLGLDNQSVPRTVAMRQYEAVIQTLERLGGQATLAELYREVMKVEGCQWGTKTPFASIHRIVQTRPEIFPVRPGLWALRSHKARLGLMDEAEGGPLSPTAIEQSHAYYQGLLVVIGNLRGLTTFVPNQDKNKLFVDRPLGQLRALQEFPAFSHPELVNRSGSVHVIWLNHRLMPHSFFEVEHTSDIQNSLLKFHDLQDFHSRMVIVADSQRRGEFEEKMRRAALREIWGRVLFFRYETLARQYEYEVLRASVDFAA